MKGFEKVALTVGLLVLSCYAAAAEPVQLSSLGNGHASGIMSLSGQQTFTPMPVSEVFNRPNLERSMKTNYLDWDKGAFIKVSDLSKETPKLQFWPEDKPSMLGAYQEELILNPQTDNINVKSGRQYWFRGGGEDPDLPQVTLLRDTSVPQGAFKGKNFAGEDGFAHEWIDQVNNAARPSYG